MMETAGSLSVGGSPSRSMVRFPAAWSRRRRRIHGIRSSRAHPHLGGAPLRHRRRVRGGGAPSVEPVYRRSLPVASRPVREVSSPAFGCEGAEVAAGVVEATCMDWARFPCGGGRRRQRAFIHGQEGSGCVSGRWSFSVCFIPFLVSGVLYGSFQSHGAMGLLRPGVSGNCSWRRSPTVADGGGLWRNRFAEVLRASL